MKTKSLSNKTLINLLPIKQKLAYIYRLPALCKPKIINLSNNHDHIFCDVFGFKGKIRGLTPLSKLS